MVKIGKTKDLPSRLKQLQTANGHQLVVLGVISGEKERVLHSLFSSSRIRGEWFTMSDEIKSFIVAHT